MAPKHATTVADFHAQAGREIARLMAECEADQSATARRLRDAGIKAEVKPAASGGYELTFTPSETAGLPEGTKRGDFKAEALAKMDAEHLAAEKERIYQWFRYVTQRGRFTTEQAASALTSLGYAALPTTQTLVEYQVRTGHRDNYGDPVRESVTFTLPGEFSTDQVRQRLAAVVPHTGPVAQALEAFPEAQGVGSPVRDLYVSYEQKWPAHSEFYAEP